MALIDQGQQLSLSEDGKEVKNEKSANGAVTNDSGESAVLYSSLNSPPPKAISGKGCWITTEEGLEILDASSGAAVACLGHNDSRVNAAILRQLEKIAYCYAPFLTSEPVEKLALELSRSTGHRLPKAFIVSSGAFTAPSYYSDVYTLDRYRGH
jgi:adenosylmethionine-8-amino-7-oxononanoate aminotransferase